MCDRIVEDASRWEDMEGGTVLIQKLNSYLTCRYIISTEVPANECLEEAIRIAALKGMVDWKVEARRILVDSFATFTTAPFESIVDFDLTWDQLPKDISPIVMKSIPAVLDEIEKIFHGT